jgi:hypothetical protein
MQNLEKLIGDARPTINMVGLTILTYGTFPILWLYENIETFGSFSRKPYTRWSIITIAALSGWAVFFSPGIGSNPDTFAFASILQMLLSIAMYIYLFVVVTMPTLNGLSDHLLATEKIDLKTNGFFAFIFSYFYINYKINEVIELRKLSERTSAGIHNELDQLEKLHALFEKGVLTQEQYEAKKASLL